MFAGAVGPCSDIGYAIAGGSTLNSGSFANESASPDPQDSRNFNSRYERPAMRGLTGPDMMTVNKMDISMMQTICIVALLMACMAIMGSNKRSTISVVKHKCPMTRSVRPSNKKICLLYDAAANIGYWRSAAA